MKPYWRLIGLRSYPDRQIPYTKRVIWHMGVLTFWTNFGGYAEGPSPHLTSTTTSDAASNRQYPQPGLFCLYTHRGHQRQCPFDYDAFLAKEEMEGGSKLNVKAFTTPNGATDCYWGMEAFFGWLGHRLPVVDGGDRTTGYERAMQCIYIYNVSRTRVNNARTIHLARY
jgi:hypothetical protein